jgi:hypothetical protein
VTATSGKSNEHVIRHGIEGELATNKAIFVGVVPYEGESEKRVIGNRPASTKLYSISPFSISYWSPWLQEISLG